MKILTALLPERYYEPCKALEFVGVNGSSGTFVYVGVADRSDFDRINAKCQESTVRSGSVLVKSVGDYGSAGVTVIFQHWLTRLSSEGMRVDRVLRERNRLLNSFGESRVRDGLLRQQIEEKEAELRALGADDTLAETTAEAQP